MELVDKLADRMADTLTERLTEKLTQRLTDRLAASVAQAMSMNVTLADVPHSDQQCTKRLMRSMSTSTHDREISLIEGLHINVDNLETPTNLETPISDFADDVDKENMAEVKTKIWEEKYTANANAALAEVERLMQLSARGDKQLDEILNMNNVEA